MRGRAIVVIAVAILAGACSEGTPVAKPVASATTTSLVLPAPPTSTPSGPAIASLPDGCAGTTPDAAATVTFIAGGRAWAVDPAKPADLTCLFPISDAGFFSWGPRGDRVVLSGLEVRGVGSDAQRPATNLHPSYFSWSRPTGLTVVFSDQSQHRMFRADVGTSGTTDITPLAGKTFGDIAYHPSGLSIGFVVKDPDGTQSIWMATNKGENPESLVQASGPESSFNHIVFAHDGTGLLYTLDRTDGTHAVMRYDLATASIDQVGTFDEPVTDVIDTPGLPLTFTTGATCSERRVLSRLNLSIPSLQPVVVGAPGPTTAIGRLDSDRFVLAVGDCGGPRDLYVTGAAGTSQLLVKAVDSAALRVPEPDPPPPLPARLPQSAVG
jgi:hypothetical protein